MARGEDEQPAGPIAAVLSSVRRRYRVFIAAAALLALGFLGGQVWRYAQTQMREDPRYRVTAQNIETTPAPPWVRTDIRLEALRDAGLRGDLSVLDPPDKLQKRLAEAFAFHPWVQSVGSVTKRPPNRVFVELTYRRPAAAVEFSTSAAPSASLAAVDPAGVRLPSNGLTQSELRRLPRVTGVVSTSLTGEVWRDARVLGAVSLINALGPSWETLDLLEVVPSRSTEVQGDLRYYVYDIVSRSGTRIVWGAAPNATPPGESSFAEKLARLERFVVQNGPLRSTFSTPEEIDIRSGVEVVARTAKLPEADKSDEEPTIQK